MRLLPVIAVLANLLALAVAPHTRADAPADQKLQQQVYICKAVSETTFIACSKGYIGSGGTLDKTTPGFKFATLACREGAKAGFSSCMGGEFPLEKLTPDTFCAHEEKFIERAITFGCDAALKADPGAKDLAKQCQSKWKPTGVASYKAYCDAQVAAEKTKTKM